ncbi:hypothetical protein [Oryzobacter terrae]|uniref:hypothetical protein n=1 Tax=Oryzobacter terrae TaxID=1620385 RepID=UPI003671A7EB
MALHCPATLLLVEEGALVGGLDAPAAAYGPWDVGTDVVAELEHLADLHRGERVLVTIGRGGVAEVLRSVGRAAPRDEPAGRLRLEVGDDGWVVLPWEPAASA